MNAASLFGIKDLRKAYSRTWRLSIDELEIPRGGVFVIVGPNGSGKSTLLRILNLLEPVDQGLISFSGEVVVHPASVSTYRRIAMVFQRPILLQGSVEWNVRYGMRVRALRDDRRVHEVLERLDLLSLSHVSVRELSGGELQRVALARALVLAPEALLLDEPTANLDPQNVRLIESIITETASGEDTTIVLVTHNIFQARRVADRVALLVGGEIVEVDQTEAFFTNPSHEKTRAFIHGEIVV